MEIEWVDINSLKPNPKNPNEHSPEQITRLAEIIKYQNWRSPIIVSNQSGLIAAGHGRLLAAKELGLLKVPVHRQDFLDEDQEYSFMVADNAIAAWAVLNMGSINAKLADFDPSFNIDLLGLKDFVIEPADKGLGDEDAVPENAPAIARLGDLYLLGNHRLLCGDSTDRAQVERLMNGEKADMVFTSPPYNLGENAKLRGYNGDGDDSVYLTKSDHKTNGEYLDFLIKFTELCLANAKTVAVNIQLLAGNKFVMSKYWDRFSDHLIDLCVWDKEHAQPALAARVLNSVWEFVFLFSDSEMPSRAIKTGKEFIGTIDNILRLNPNKGPREESKELHGAVFPVAFAEHFISNFSGPLVYEPFCGSGSTLIACEKTNRRCFGCEIDPHYCDVIIKRWEDYTGKKAEKLI